MNHPSAPHPAFKEWHAVVGALAVGAQTIILRKGGIAEERGGFRPRGEPFWLLPTRFHEQAAKLRTEAAPFLPSAEIVPAGVVELTAWAELHTHRFVSDRAAAHALAPYHLWRDATVDERFDWARPPGLHLLIVRVHRLRTPIRFALTEAQAGCKSWVELPLAPPAAACTPALDDASFQAAVEQILATLEP